MQDVVDRLAQLLDRLELAHKVGCLATAGVSAQI